MGPATHSRSVEALEMVKEGQTQTGLPGCWCSIQWTAAFTSKAMRNGKRIFRTICVNELRVVYSTMKH